MGFVRKKIYCILLLIHINLLHIIYAWNSYANEYIAYIATKKIEILKIGILITKRKQKIFVYIFARAYKHMV